MYNLDEETNKSCELKDLFNLDQLGFKIIPLRENSVRPNVPSTNDIYNNPQYWSEAKIRRDHHLFQNVATLLGKSHVKDESDKDLYLNVIDIDSDRAFTRLARCLSKNGKDVYLIDDLCKSTYVTKTKKKFGYHIYWLSHNQNKPIRTGDCRVGCEFEIKTDNAGHSTLPPSRHRDDPNFHYKAVGQNTIFVNDRLYGVLVDVLSDFIRGRQTSSKQCIDEPDNEITSTKSAQIASILTSTYRNGARNDIIFVLSGFLWHKRFTLNAVESVVKELCKITGDEEIENRLMVVRNTYKNANDEKPITGTNRLIEILERAEGVETANQIINDISRIINKNNNEVLSQLDTEVRAELSSYIFEITCYDPLTLVVAHAVKKQILTCKIARNLNRDATDHPRPKKLSFGDVIINAIPENIVRYESPLNDDQIKYKIDFIPPIGKPFTTLPKSPDKITSDLKMRGVVYKPRVAEEALNAVLNGAQRAKRVTVVRQIDTPGFYYVDGKIATSDVDVSKPPSEDITICAKFLNDLITRSKHPEMLVTVIKWGILSPYSFVLKELSDEEGCERWLPWLYLDGYTKTSKTTDGTIALSIYRKQKNRLSLASANNVARLGEAISHDTFPRLIDEVKLDPKIHSDLVEAIKHAVQGQTARTKLSISSEQIHIPALGSCIFTSDHQLPSDPAFRRRFLNFHYPKDDKPTEDEISNFQSFLKSGRNSLGTLGDFASHYLSSNQEIITNDRNDWQTIAKTVIEEFYKTANLNIPTWIDMISAGNQIEDVEAEEEQIIRAFFVKRINDTFSRSYKSMVSWKDQEEESASNKYKLIEMRLNFCLDNELISFMRRKSTNPGDILITNDILKEFRDTGISFIQTFTDLGRMLGTILNRDKY